MNFEQVNTSLVKSTASKLTYLVEYCNADWWKLLQIGTTFVRSLSLSSIFSRNLLATISNASSGHGYKTNNYKSSNTEPTVTLYSLVLILWITADKPTLSMTVIFLFEEYQKRLCWVVWFLRRTILLSTKWHHNKNKYNIIT